ncbi:MAG: GMC family oxidoreductase [Pseudomonadota bacterium]
MRGFLDSRRVPEGTEISADVAIIGAGAAGLTVAQGLLGLGLKVAVFEAGGLNPRKEDNALLDVDVQGDEYHVVGTRLRYYGGTTNHWGGQCFPLEAKDFERLPWIPHSGWPYGLDTLIPYYRRAHEIMGLGEFDYDAQAASATTGKPLFGLDGGGAFRTVIGRYNPHRFGLALDDVLTQDGDTDVYLFADLSELVLDEGGNAVSTGRFLTTASTSFTVRARYFVLAAGGIENARLLLTSNRQRPAGLGNGSDLVGRFFQEHIWYESGQVVPSRSLDREGLYLEHHVIGGGRIRASIAATRELEEAHGLPGFRADLRGMFPYSLAAADLRAGTIRAEDMALLVADPGTAFAAALCGGEPPLVGFTLANYFQMPPDPDHRVRLSERRDILGRPLPVVDFRIGSDLHDSLRRAHVLLATEIAKLGLGRMRVELPEAPETPLEERYYGAHHIGTTRMAASPREGVVDADARVHEVANLYVAGSAIFPTCGWQNPTLTIAATSLKLAEHLKSVAT